MRDENGKTIFGIYTFRLKNNKIDNNLYMIGEVNSESEKYKGLDIETAGRLRINEELFPKNGVNSSLGLPTKFDEIVEDLKIFKIASDRPKNVDKEFHRFLKNKGYEMYKDEEHNTEIFHISRPELDLAMKAWSTNNPDLLRTKLPFEARTYQKRIITECNQKLRKISDVLIYVATRAGKSFISLKIAKKNNAKNILIVTPYPAAEGSFRDIAEFNTEYSGYRYIRFNAETDVSEIDENDKHVIFASWQFLDLDKDSVKEFCKKLSIDFVILDEIHNTSDSKRSETILENFHFTKNCKRIWLSGSPFEDILSGKFKPENTVTFSLFQFLDFSRKEMKKFLKTGVKPEIFLPEPHIRNIDNFEQIYDELSQMAPEVFPPEEKTSNIEAFHTHGEHCVFNKLEKAKVYFKYLLRNPETKNAGLILKSSYNEQKFFTGSKEKQNVILAYFDSTQQVDIATQALNELKDSNFDSPLSEYEIFKVSGNSDETLVEATEDEINGILKTHKKAIIVSCAKLTTGVTIPRLDTIWLFRKIASVELFTQIIARPLSEFTDENGKVKKNVNIYCFDSDTLMGVMSSLIDFEYKICKDKTKTYKEFVEDALDYLNFEAYTTDLTFDDVSADDFLESVKELETKTYGSYNPVQIFKDLSFLPEDLDIDVEMMKFTKETKFVEKENSNREVVIDSEKSETEEKDEETFDSETIKKFLSALAYLDRIIVSRNITHVEDLKERGCPEELKDYKNYFKCAVDKNAEKLRTLIDNLNWTKHYGDKLQLTRQLCSKSHEDSTTPFPLIEKMTSFIDKETLENKEAIFCDPCMGCGAILIYLHQVKGVEKSRLFGMDIDKNNIEYMKSLGYNNVYLWKGEVQKGKRTIVMGAQDKSEWDRVMNEIKKDVNITSMEKDKSFDFILMNPPFDKNLHLKILRQALNHSTKVVNLSPDDFRYNLGSYITWSKDLDIKELETHLISTEHLSYEEGWALFGLGKRLDDSTGLSISLYSLEENHELKDIWENESLFKRLQKDFCKDNFRRNFIRSENLSEFGQKIFRWHPYTREDYYNSIICETGNAKEGLDFTSEEEKKNFKNSIHCWPYKLSVLHFNDINPAHLPYVGNTLKPGTDSKGYLTPWTDEDFYKFFNLTPEEIKIIEDTMEKYK